MTRAFWSVPILAALLAGPAPAADVPLADWPVPGPGAHVRTMADASKPAVFVGVTPCRIVDTRGGAPLTGGPMAASTPRSYTLGGQCGVPATAGAISLNVTVVGPGGPGYVSVWPQGGSQPVVSTLNYTAGAVVANAAVVPMGTGGNLGGVTFVCMNFGCDLVVDTNGYYVGGSDLNTGEQLALTAHVDGLAAIVGFNYANADGSHGVGGFAGGSGKVHGVQGQVGSAAAAGSSGVHGVGASAVGKIVVGVLGESTNTVDDSAGILGRDGTTIPAPASLATTTSAGVRGESANVGVAGVSAGSGWGAGGFYVTALGNLGPYGYLGGAGYGVYAYGNTGASGTKSFVEPHPTKPDTVIRYVSLEGPEAGTYFRGRARTAGGRAVIPVPESFRLVTDEEGITVQVTPLGRATAVGVTRVGLDEIEVESVRDVEFSYLVQGVRRTFKDFQVEVVSDDFMPRAPDARLPEFLSEGQKRNLIQAGVYNEDGTVNRATARRLGWERVWEARARGDAR